MAASLWETLCIYPTLSIHGVSRKRFLPFSPFFNGARGVENCRVVDSPRKSRFHAARKTVKNGEKTVFAGDLAASNEGIRYAPISAFFERAHFTTGGSSHLL